MNSLSLILLSVAVGAGPAVELPVAQPTGQTLFVQRCSACHAASLAGEAQWGPNLFGVMDRSAGSVPDYRYASYLRGQQTRGVAWDSASLGPWLVDSKAVAKAAGARTKMPAQGLSDEEVRRVIAYLETLR